MRQQAALQLKNIVKRSWHAIPQNVKAHVQNTIPNGLAHKNVRFRKYASAVIGMIVYKGDESWPNLLQTLLQALCSNNITAIEGSLLCLQGLCQGQQARIEDEQQYLQFDTTVRFICRHEISIKIVEALIKFMPLAKSNTQLTS